MLNRWKQKLNQYYRNKYPLLVLMYHDLSHSTKDGLTVLTSDFIQQMEYLNQEGFSFLTLTELEMHHQHHKELPNNACLITFDDGYLSSCEILKNLLHSQLPFLKVNMFLPMGYLGQVNHWDFGNKKIISETELIKFNTPHWNWGFHSYEHKNYRHLSIDEIVSDVQRCQDKKEKIIKMGTPSDLTSSLSPMTANIAYPYGAYLKQKQQQQVLDQTFKQAGISFAFRIGNRRNSWPLKNPYLIERMDIRGDRDFSYFKKQVG